MASFYVNRPLSDPPKDYELLTGIGLTKHQAACYGLLCGHSSLRASDLAITLHIRYQNVYPLLRDLALKGFIIRHKVIGNPFYTAVPLDQALVNYSEYQRTVVKPLLTL